MNSCMTAIELALLERSYQQCANNIHSIPGSLWTPEGAGLLEPARHNEAINVRGDHIDGRLSEPGMPTLSNSWD
jgi:hypothetical protein